MSDPHTVTTARHSGGRLFAPLLLVTLLGACVSTPDSRAPDGDENAWQVRRQSLEEITDWEMTGRLAVRTTNRGGSMSLRWQRTADEHRISLSGPLGGGRVILVQDDTGATLRDSRKQVYRAATAEELLLRVTGWRVPFQELQHWVLGIPAPRGKYQPVVGENGRLTALRQAGWEVRFQRYRQFAGLELPDKLHLEALPGVRPTGSGDEGDGAVRIKAVIKGWEWGRGQIDTGTRGPHNTRFSRGQAGLPPVARTHAARSGTQVHAVRDARSQPPPWVEWGVAKR